MKSLYLFFALSLTKLSYGAPPESDKPITPNVRGGTATTINRIKIARSLQSGNTAPSPQEDEVSTPFNTAVTIPVLDNDSDADGDTISILSNTKPSNGVAVLIRTGSGKQTIKYDPNEGFIGTDQFFYTISDGNRGYGVARIVVNVLAPKEEDLVKAQANDDIIVTPINTSVTIHVLDNDNVDKSDALKIIASSQPRRGSATLSDDGTTITYTPDLGFVGNDRIYYMVTDGERNRSTALITIRVVPSSGEPVAVDDFVSIPANTAVTIRVVDNDFAQDPSTLKIATALAPMHGSATVSPGLASIKYTPAQDFVGTDRLSYTLVGSSESATVTIRVVAPEATTLSTTGEP